MMAGSGDGRGGVIGGLLALVGGVVIGGFVVLVLFLDALGASAACSPSAAVIDPESVPEGPIAGYGHEQLVNAATIAQVAADKQLPARRSRSTAPRATRTRITMRSSRRPRRRSWRLSAVSRPGPAVSVTVSGRHHLTRRRTCRSPACTGGVMPRSRATSTCIRGSTSRPRLGRRFSRRRPERC